ncbi:hypothetical protein F2P81_009629 [Scophthalmus maximus]|uniref:Uncharacterized protein n=1 Tax=Scophthalmus maximus TaxID=52904 RepID=A0A6A4T234_SCOMX|nr:hypothetical protein F2P81_009629 [Scophthalmus maximus]
MATVFYCWASSINEQRLCTSHSGHRAIHIRQDIVVRFAVTTSSTGMPLRKKQGINSILLCMLYKQLYFCERLDDGDVSCCCGYCRGLPQEQQLPRCRREPTKKNEKGKQLQQRKKMQNTYGFKPLSQSPPPMTTPS